MALVEPDPYGQPAVRDAQRSSEGQLRGIVQSAMDAIITVDDAHRIVLFNHAAELAFGYPAATMIGEALDRLIPERYRGVHGEHMRTFGATGMTTRQMGGKLALFGLRANGEEFPIDASISQTATDGRKLYTVILRDVSERKKADAEVARAHRELRELSRAANEALEEERRRVARELHDELGQQLSAMRMDLEGLKRSLPTERPDLIDRCEKVCALLDMTVASTRRISSDLRPLMLDDLGLGAAIDWLAKNLARRSGIAIDVEIDESLAEVQEPLASTIFRIVQESLTNVARHAAASHALVRVEGDLSFAHIIVTDNGKGITVEDQRKRTSFGLRGIRERAGLLGGEASIGHAPGGGTVVRVRLPLAPEPSDEGWH